MKKTVKRWAHPFVFDGDPDEHEAENIGPLYDLRKCRNNELACPHCEFMAIGGPTKAQVKAGCVPVRIMRDPGPPRRIVIEEIPENAAA